MSKSCDNSSDINSNSISLNKRDKSKYSLKLLIPKMVLLLSNRYQAFIFNVLLNRGIKFSSTEMVIPILEEDLIMHSIAYIILLIWTHLLFSFTHPHMVPIYYTLRNQEKTID